MTAAYQPASPNTAIWFAAVTPSDSANQATPFRGLYVGGTGDLTVCGNDGNVVTFKAVPVGFFPVGGIRVNATNTTATNIVALY